MQDDTLLEDEKVPKHNPLKQGLKLSPFATSPIFSPVPKHNPLKQGLKLKSISRDRRVLLGSKA